MYVEKNQKKSIEERKTGVPICDRIKKFFKISINAVIIITKLGGESKTSFHDKPSDCVNNPDFLLTLKFILLQFKLSFVFAS